MRHNEHRTMDDDPAAGPDPRATQRARDTRWVADALAGDQRAFGRLYDAWFDRVYNLALGVVRDPETAADVAQDTFLAAWKNLGTLEDPDAFGGWLLRIARNTSFNRSKKEGRSRPVDDEAMAVIEATGATPGNAPTGFGAEQRLAELADPARLAGDGELVALVHEAAAALGPRDAEVLDLQLRYGLTPAEIGEVIGVNRNAANQLCHRIRGRFATAVRARVLWRGDRPACDDLADLLASAGVERFDAEAVRLADRHAPGCAVCSNRRDTRLEPSAMFAAVPLVAAPVLFKAKVAGALEAAGVPMDGSAASASPADGSAGSNSSSDPGGSGAEAGDGPITEVVPAAEPGGDDDEAGHSTSAGRRRRVAAMALAAAVLLALLVAVLADDLDEGTATDVAASGTTATSAPASTTTEASTTSVEETTTTAGEEPTTTTTAAPTTTTTQEPTTTTTLPPPTVRFTTTGQTAPSWPMGPGAPAVVWSVTGGGAARVTITPPPSDTQPVWSSISALSGRQAVCPGTGQSFCLAQVGNHTYTLRVYDASGVELAVRTVTVTVEPFIP